MYRLQYEVHVLQRRDFYLLIEDKHTIDVYLAVKLLYQLNISILIYVYGYSDCDGNISFIAIVLQRNTVFFF